MGIKYPSKKALYNYNTKWMTPAEELQSGDREPTLQTRSPVIKTGIPPTHILTEKTCFNHREKPAFITWILFTLQWTCFQNSCGSLNAPCSTLYGIVVYIHANK